MSPWCMKQAASSTGRKYGSWLWVSQASPQPTELLGILSDCFLPTLPCSHMELYALSPLLPCNSKAVAAWQVTLGHCLGRTPQPLPPCPGAGLGSLVLNGQQWAEWPGGLQAGSLPLPHRAPACHLRGNSVLRLQVESGTPQKQTSHSSTPTFCP